MSLKDWLKTRGKQHSDLPQTQSNVSKASASTEEVFFEGFFDDPLKAVSKEQSYMATHHCHCGGKWERTAGDIGGDGTYTVATSYCVCNRCRAEKKFVFKFHGWNDGI